MATNAANNISWKFSIDSKWKSWNVINCNGHDDYVLDSQDESPIWEQNTHLKMQFGLSTLWITVPSRQIWFRQTKNSTCGRNSCCCVGFRASVCWFRSGFLHLICALQPNRRHDSVILKFKHTRQASCTKMMPWRHKWTIYILMFYKKTQPCYFLIFARVIQSKNTVRNTSWVNFLMLA